MHGIEVEEKDHRVVITVDTEIIDRSRIDQALSVLEIPHWDDSHIPSMDPEEQEEISTHLRSMTPDDREYTLHRKG